MSSPKRKYIEAAYELLREEGLDGVSIRRVASRAGTSSTAIYKHFGNIDELVTVASYRFLREYTNDARILSEVDLNPLELNLQLWECFAFYSFQEAPIFENMLFGDGREGTLANAASMYYEEFPEDIEEMPDFMNDMLQGVSMFRRDKVLLDQAAEVGMLTEEGAEYLCAVDTYLYRGMLAMIHDTYDKAGVARTATHDFMQLVIKSYLGQLQEGFTVLVTEPEEPRLGIDSRGGAMNSYRVKVISLPGQTTTARKGKMPDALNKSATGKAAG